MMPVVKGKSSTRRQILFYAAALFPVGLAPALVGLGGPLYAAAATLFGGERIWRYNFDFPTTDRKLLALEYHELARCIRSGAKPEVDGAMARRKACAMRLPSRYSSHRSCAASSGSVIRASGGSQRDPCDGAEAPRPRRWPVPR